MVFGARVVRLVKANEAWSDLNQLEWTVAGHRLVGIYIHLHTSTYIYIHLHTYTGMAWGIARGILLFCVFECICMFEYVLFPPST